MPRNIALTYVVYPPDEVSARRRGIYDYGGLRSISQDTASERLCQTQSRGHNNVFVLVSRHWLSVRSTKHDDTMRLTEVSAYYH